MGEELDKIKTELTLRGFSENTVAAYILHSRKFFEYTKKPALEITEDDIKTYLSKLIEKKLSAASIALIFSSLKFYFQEILRKDIFKNIKIPKKEKKLPEVLTKDEVKALLEAAKNKKSKLIISLLYSSGLRLSESLNLKTSDLELKERVGWVRRGKGKKDRLFILSEKLVSEIEEYLKNKKTRDLEFLFAGQKGRMSSRNVQKIISSAAKRAGIKKRVSPHTLRHCFATHLLSSGIDIRKIQALLGHTNLNTTQMYAHVSPEELKKIKSPLDMLE